jgi:transcription elongation factor GreA
MASDNIFMTRDGYEKLREEVEYLKKVKRKEISKAIGEAREHGDLSENADYDAAKDAQAMNEKRIHEVESKLIRTRILEDQGILKHDVRIGAKVTLKDLESGDEIEYMLLSEMEADFSKGIISINSPVAQGLLGHKEDDIVEIKLPSATLKDKILSIS